MTPDPHAIDFDEEISEIENRGAKRTLFLVLGGIVALVLLLIVIVGGRERSRLAAEAARPKFEEVVLGRYVGQASNQALFAEGERLNYVEGIGESDVGATTTFARPLEYDAAGNPIPAPAGTFFWSLESADSLPYVIEPVVNPLTGVTPADYRALDLSTLARGDYGSGGAGDWQPLEAEETQVSVTGTLTRAEDAVYLVDEPNRARLQGIEGLSALDSLEVAWATESGAPLSTFGRISSTPRGADEALFVMTVNAVQPPVETAAAAPAAVPPPADTTAAP
jgi:hypothetical protein